MKNDLPTSVQKENQTNQSSLQKTKFTSGMTTQRHFSISFPEEMEGLIDFLFVRSSFLGIQLSKNIKKSLAFLFKIF